MTSAETFFPISFKKGSVWLVGAGPGDIGLLTLYACEAIREADIIIYDALVNEKILDLAHKDTQKIYAGKRGGKPSPKQDDITKRLIEEAKKNKKVLRLKGGDPFVFARGSEECLQLVKENIEFQIVPGVTSAIAALSYAGIPLSHRAMNHSFMFLTGHSLTGDIPSDFDWDAIHKASPMLIFYMGMRHAAVIAHKLMEAGRKKDEHVAIISHATTPKMRTIQGYLHELEEMAKAAEAPSIIAIGPNVELRDLLQWWDKA